MDLTTLTKLDTLPWYANYAINSVIALVIIIAALWIAAFAKRSIQRIGQRYEHLDNTLFSFLGSFARYGILAIAGIFILGRFGLDRSARRTYRCRRYRHRIRLPLSDHL